MNITEILKDCPKGTKLYSPLFGECELVCSGYKSNDSYPIIIKAGDESHCFTKNGLFYREYTDGECMLFPSKDNRDWSTFKVHKECEFKPFDKVLVRDKDTDIWRIEFFSRITNISDYKYQTLSCGWKQCIPYEGNEHLLGTRNSPK